MIVDKTFEKETAPAGKGCLPGIVHFCELQQKRYLGLKSFMIRTAMAIDRFLIILTVAWFFLTCKDGVPQPLYVSARRYRGFLSIL